ncbi:MAG: hypothetical protein ABIG84_00495 [archaeon]
MKKIKMLLVFLIIASYISFSISTSFAEEDYHHDNDNPYQEEFEQNLVKEGKFLRHKDTGILAHNPDELDGTVTSPTELTIDKIAFKYKNYNNFIMIPDDNEPSIILIFNKGSVKSTLYIDKKAKEILDESGSSIEIITEGSTSSSLIVDKSDIQPTDTSGIFAIEIKDKDSKKDLTGAIKNELKTGSKTIYPKITSPDSTITGSKVTIKDPTLTSIKNFKDLILWINLQFNTNLDNDEKKILKDGILLTLEKTVEDATSPPLDETLPEEPIVYSCPIE